MVLEMVSSVGEDDEEDSSYELDWYGYILCMDWGIIYRLNDFRDEVVDGVGF